MNKARPSSWTKLIIVPGAGNIYVVNFPPEVARGVKYELIYSTCTSGKGSQGRQGFPQQQERV